VGGRPREKATGSKMPLKKRPSEYLRQRYFDSLVFTPEALQHLVAECGASQIVMGTDYLYPWTRTTVDYILGTPSLSDAERAAILGDTAPTSSANGAGRYGHNACRLVKRRRTASTAGAGSV
jgi:predicted TIM-barrel fold metal-dependent hydrolase